MDKQTDGHTDGRVDDQESSSPIVGGGSIKLVCCGAVQFQLTVKLYSMPSKQKKLDKPFYINNSSTSLVVSVLSKQAKTDTRCKAANFERSTTLLHTTWPKTDQSQAEWNLSVQSNNKLTIKLIGWWSGVVVSALASINEVNQRRARLVLRRVTVFGFNSRCRTLISVCNQQATQGQLSLPSLQGQ